MQDATFGRKEQIAPPHDGHQSAPGHTGDVCGAVPSHVACQQGNALPGRWRMLMEGVEADRATPHEPPTGDASARPSGPWTSAPPGTEEIEAFSFLAPDDRDALDRLVPQVYRELRTIAHRHLAAHGGEDTLNSTALVHEAYLKLGREAGVAWQDRAHFFALASMVMRQILTDRARARVAFKRGGVQRRVTLEEDTIAVDDQAESLLDLTDALTRLAEVSPRLVRVVEFRFFGGMSDAEIGHVLGVTERTVRRDWDKARLLLRRALGA